MEEVSIIIAEPDYLSQPILEKEEVKKVIYIVLFYLNFHRLQERLEALQRKLERK